LFYGSYIHRKREKIEIERKRYTSLLPSQLQGSNQLQRVTQQLIPSGGDAGMEKGLVKNSFGSYAFLMSINRQTLSP
jgi:hypothetical protein